jgi:AraC family transcriptional regulator
MRMKNNTQQLFIKNMVCPRCIKVVQQELYDLGYQVKEVKLGFAEIFGEIDRAAISKMLVENGFELLEEKNKQLVDKIKTEIISLIHHQEDLGTQNLSAYLSEKLATDYTTLSHLFSSLENTTIEKYHILQRVEKAKELLVYNQLSLKEIAFQLHYSSVAHLSAQFKKITGFTPKYYKEIGLSRRKPIDAIQS